MKKYEPPEKLILKVYALADDLKEEQKKIVKMGREACEKENQKEAFHLLSAMKALISTTVGTIICQCIPESMSEEVLKVVKIWLPGFYEKREKKKGKA